jgi:hypothetical protein
VEIFVYRRRRYEIVIQIELIIGFRELEGFILLARSGNRKR